MKADTLTLKALFQKDIRYVIPTFQRPYVWNEENQWEPLWNDVVRVAERLLKQPDGKHQPHFLGAVDCGAHGLAHAPRGAGDRDLDQRTASAATWPSLRGRVSIAESA